MDVYEQQGKDWLAGKIRITGWQGKKLNKTQIEFINDKSRYALVCGGFASGKTTAFLIKMYLLCMWFPCNRILLGRKTRQDIERTTLPDILDVFPEGTFEHKLGAGKIVFPNGSEIIFFGLDALQSGNGQDIKKAEQQIKSLNLGAVFIDQLEEIEFRVFEALTGRLRRNVPFQQMNFTCNPANFWAYDWFKVNPRPNTKLIQTSMMDNKDNLSKEFIEDQLTKGALYVKRYVYGEWSPDTMVQGGVFPEEYIKDQAFHVQAPVRTFNGLNIFVEPNNNHEYQIGVDPSQGVVDPCGIIVVDKDTGEIVASYRAFVNTEAQVEKTVQLAIMYAGYKRPMVVPERNGAGLAFVEALKKVWDVIYVEEKPANLKESFGNKLGWVTSHSSKTRLIENMKSLLNKKFAKWRDGVVVEETKTFIYSDDANQKGAGAQTGYHDDQIMATMMAYWGIVAKSLKDETSLVRRLLQAKAIKQPTPQTSYE
jgi:PBSX family phage terminase large subunit